MTITHNLLKELFDYQDGNLYWKIRKAQRIKIGDIAGTDDDKGYRSISINGKLYYAHRLIFLYHNGYLPEELDHIDGNPSNNNISNLRASTRSQNHQNEKKNKSYGGKPTSSIYKGVYWRKRDKKWAAQIVIDTKRKALGNFNSEIEAALSYNHAALEAFGEFARINNIGDI